MASASACRVLEASAVVAPTGRVPRSRRGRGPRRRRPRPRGRPSRGGMPGRGPGPGRRGSASTAPAKMNREKRRAFSSVIGSVATLSARASQPVRGVDREARVEPARDDEPASSWARNSRRDGEPSLVVHRVPVLAGEHRRASPLRVRCLACAAVIGGLAGVRSPLWATSHHFRAYSAQRAPSMGNRAYGQRGGAAARLRPEVGRAASGLERPGRPADAAVSGWASGSAAGRRRGSGRAGPGSSPDPVVATRRTSWRCSAGCRRSGSV